MKILAIRLCNIAALAGEQCLDFTQPPLADAPLFALVGPTGSGKSSVLDALCLALYGTTPRLQRASHKGRMPQDDITFKDPRNLLRRGAAQGYAEVDFIGVDDQAYRARWSVRRARHQASGRLQAAEQSLTRLSDHTLLTQQSNEFKNQLPTYLGLTYEQFSRAVLLAQSEFSAFIQAEDAERSALLERLTGTELYSRIGQLAFAQARDAQQAVKEIEQRLGHQTPLDADTRAALDQHLTEVNAQLAQLKQQRQALQQAFTWQQQAQQLNTEKAQRLNALHTAQKDQDQIAPLAQRLQALDQAADILPQHREHQQLCAQTPALITEQTEQQNIIAQYQEAQAQQQQTLTQTEAECQQAEQALNEAQPKIDAAQHCDYQLTSLTEQHQELRQRWAQEQAQQAQRWQSLESLCHELGLTTDLEALPDTLAQAITQLDEQLDSTQVNPAYIDFEHPDFEHRDSEHRDSEHAPLRQVSLDLPLDEETLRTYEQQLETLTPSLQQAQQLAELDQQSQALQAQLKQLYQQLQEDQANEQQAQERYAQAKPILERQRRLRQDHIIELRTQLTPGEPCSVCGSLEHPWADPERLEAALTQLDADVERQQLDELSAEVERCHTQRLRSESHLNSVETQDQQLATRRQSLSQTWQYQLPRHCQGARQADDPVQWLTTQQQRLRNQRDQLRQLLEVQRAQQQQRLKLQTHRQHLAQVQTQLTQYQEQEQACQALQKRLEQNRENQTNLNTQRQTLLGEYDTVSQWQHQLQQRRNAAQTQWREAEKALQDTQLTLTRLESNHQHLTERLSQQQDRIAELNNACQTWLAQHPDVTSADLDRLLLDMPQAEQWRQQWQAAQTQTQQAQARLDDAQERWAQHQANAPVAADQTDLTQQLSDIDHQVETLDEQRLQDYSQIQQDDQQRAAQKQLSEALNQARQTYHRWQRLNEVIGDREGKTFRTMAQSVSLELLLAHANQQLQHLARRYRLQRGSTPMSLLVLDTEMGDEVRSVHSLSGGETFLVSLALALGLAGMASGHLRIESLFIDEGFGSLDPQSLQLAMDALDGLQAQGRKVGVISHVQEMHERMPVQIQVERQGNGASRLVVLDE
ncbi:hypothetical protein BFW38_11750 [Terasakiispira papahanaumokuakeensis]|uniref:Nuclease SbcCD subunit C n=1 Tax=Terasakiispira papahanaumokuakeensis TaxID=197479 RepID=A0A1E2VAV0_9GAMM|nr:AAA family ATPase [Terasakiispira papahanaumokuakeensis]ODC04101.1 hypothetical protein BFW38_11750 [Terasakiispira papahanaumokuakeensis]